MFFICLTLKVTGDLEQKIIYTYRLKLILPVDSLTMISSMLVIQTKPVTLILKELSISIF